MKHYTTTPLCRLVVSTLFAVFGLMMAGPAMADNVLVPNTESGIAEATHTWTDADGNVFGFSVVHSDFTVAPTELNLCGVQPSPSTTALVIPDLLLMNDSVKSVVSISDDAFQGSTALTTLTLPATLVYVNCAALNVLTSLTDIYCRAFLPPLVQWQENYAATNDIGTARLHVPAPALTRFRDAAFWSEFSETVALSEDATLVSLYDTFTVTDLTGIAPQANLQLTSNRVHPYYYSYFYGLIEGEHAAHVDVSTPWQVGNFHMAQTTEYKRLYYNYYEKYYRSDPEGFTSTLIPQSPMTATGDVTVQLDCRNGGWKFISFPFDVCVRDITVSCQAQWVIRRFSPRDRGALTSNIWQNLTSRDTLKANTGYIIYTLTPNVDVPPYDPGKGDIPMLTVKPTNATKQDLFTTADVTVPLVESYAVEPPDQNWNFVGNPYPAFYHMGESDFTAPYTIWSRIAWANTYETYSPIDDNHVLLPFEGFFVQCPSGVNSITFRADGRSHERENPVTVHWVRRQAQALQHRQLYNIYLSAGESSDRTRIVVNPEAKESYELECDAQKMMTTNPAVSQIYVIDGGIQYAIDERPLGSGLFTLGALFTQDGEYTLRLETRGDAQPVALTDRLTGRTFDLSQGEEYTFHAEAGTANGRLSLAIGDEATGIGSLTPNPSPKGEGSIYNLNGQRISQPVKGISIINGKKYVIK